MSPTGGCSQFFTALESNSQRIHSSSSTHFSGSLAMVSSLSNHRVARTDHLVPPQGRLRRSRTHSNPYVHHLLFAPRLDRRGVPRAGDDC